MTLSAKTTGGPPKGVWLKGGSKIEQDDPNFSITFELDQSIEDFEHLCPYTSRLRSHGPTSAKFSYLVTNKLTRGFLVKGIAIEGKYTVKYY